MNIVAIETATDVCSVALMQGEHVTIELTISRPRAHAENLILLVRSALSWSGLAPTDIGAVAVSMGPGSFTGLRIGVSAAKGLATAWDAQLVGVPTMEGLAASIAPLAGLDTTILAALNSRRDEVYAAIYRMDKEGTTIPLKDASAVQVDELADWLGPFPSSLLFIGEGAPKAHEALRILVPAGGLRLLNPAVYKPSAAWIARLGLERLKRGDTVDVASFEPFYLKDFVAKRRERSIFERLPF